MFLVSARHSGRWMAQITVPGSPKPPSLDRSYCDFDAFSYLPFVKVGNAKLIVKVIRAGQDDLRLLGFV
jgi:hypothetical protein